MPNEKHKVKIAPVEGLDPERQQAWLQGIAAAEGYGKPGAVPTRAHNPGDLKIGDVGYGREPGGITHFPNEDAGYNALARQVNKFYIPGPNYNPQMTLADIADKYTSHDNAPGWTQTVAQHVGIEPDAPLVPDRTTQLLGTTPQKYAVKQAQQVTKDIVKPQPVGVLDKLYGMIAPPPTRENDKI